MKLMFTAYPIKRILPPGCPELFELDKTKPSRHDLFDKNDPTSKYHRWMLLISIPFWILLLLGLAGAIIVSVKSFP